MVEVGVQRGRIEHAGVAVQPARAVYRDDLRQARWAYRREVKEVKVPYRC